MPQLRPMSTGEILDRTFSNYRHNFKLFAGIAAIPNGILLIVKLLILLVAAANMWTPTSRTLGGAALTFTIISAIVTGILYLICLAVSQGATAFAVSAVHLENPTTVRESYRRIKGRYGRMVNVILSVYLRCFGVIFISYLFIFVAVFVPATLGIKGEALSIVFGLVAFVGMVAGIFIGIRLFARYSLAVPAAIIEDMKTRPAMKRSVFLSKGSVGKILAIYVLFLIISMAAAFAVAIPIQMMVVVSKAALWTTLVAILQDIGSFAVGSIVGPMATIGLSLVYFDERVRKEAFDIQYMMESLPPTAPVGDAPSSGAMDNVATAFDQTAEPQASVAPEGQLKANGAGAPNS